MEATQFLRNTIKYIFIIWALVLGVYMLFYITSRAAWHQQAPEATNQMAEPAEQTKPVNAANNPDSGPGTNVDEQPAAAIAQQAPTSATDDATNPAVVVDTAELQATNKSDKKPDNLAPKFLTVTAYRAELFDAIDNENAKTIPLLKDSQVLFIERQGEWIKVTTADSKNTGYIHSSQVVSN